MRRVGVPGWPGYVATEAGEVLSKSGSALSHTTHYRTGHMRIRLYGPLGHLRGTKGGWYANFYVHQVICMAFHGSPPFDGAIVRHLDDDPTNNVASNLAWGSHQDNMDDRLVKAELLTLREERAAMREEPESYAIDESIGF